MHKSIIVLALGFASLLLGACASSPEQVERDFGNSVRNMVRSQTLDPATANRPATEPVDHGDGQRIDNVMDAYRQDVAKPEKVSEPLVMLSASRLSRPFTCTVESIVTVGSAVTST